MFHSLKKFVGFKIQASDAPCGHVADIYVDDVTWAVRHIAVMDHGGIGIQMASVEPDQVARIDAKSKKLHVSRTRDDIAGGPDVTLDPPVSHHVNNENDPHLRSIEEIAGYKVVASDGAVGTLDDFLIDAEHWKIGIIVVADEAGRKVAIGPGLIDRLDFDAKSAHVELDKSHFARSPAYDPAKPVKRLEDVPLVGREGV